MLIVAGCEDVRIPDPAVRYVAFGDSSTAGPTDRDYPQILQERLGLPAEQFANEGNGGETTAEGLERLNGLLADGIYPNATTLLYWEGGNDVIAFLRQVDPLLVFSPDDADYPYADQLDELLAGTQANAESVIARAQSAGLTVFVATYPLRPESLLPCESLPIKVMLPGQTTLANQYTQRINDRIRAAATNTGATLVDAAAAVPAESANWYDCTHLSVTGNDLAAAVFAAAIH
jgi:lysophospholipase L1-like esterase